MAECPPAHKIEFHYTVESPAGPWLASWWECRYCGQKWQEHPGYEAQKGSFTRGEQS